MTEKQRKKFNLSERIKLHVLEDMCTTRIEKMRGKGPCVDCCLRGEGHKCPSQLYSTKDLDKAWQAICSVGIEKLYGEEINEMIKDSGNRTEFGTGAVRDMHTGKGRYDLLPMCVIDRLAKHYEAGALKYSDRNWEQGIPAHSFADSAMRHFTKYMDGQNDEDHLIAAIWNLCGLAWTEMKKPEMMDIPARMELKEEQNLYDVIAETVKNFEQFQKGMGIHNASPNVSREALLHKLANFDDSEGIKVKYVKQMINRTGTDADDGMPIQR